MRASIRNTNHTNTRPSHDLCSSKLCVRVHLLKLARQVPIDIPKLMAEIFQSHESMSNRVVGPDILPTTVVDEVAGQDPVKGSNIFPLS
jgi:hypothetical protein